MSNKFLNSGGEFDISILQDGSQSLNIKSVRVGDLAPSSNVVTDNEQELTTGIQQNLVTNPYNQTFVVDDIQTDSVSDKTNINTINLTNSEIKIDVDTETYNINTTGINLNNKKITGSSEPVNSSDLATKQYVDNNSGGNPFDQSLNTFDTPRFNDIELQNHPSVDTSITNLETKTSPISDTYNNPFFPATHIDGTLSVGTISTTALLNTNCFAYGNDCQAIGDESLAGGKNSYTNSFGLQSVALGLGCEAIRAQSWAVGSKAKNLHDNTFVFGTDTNIFTYSQRPNSLTVGGDIVCIQPSNTVPSAEYSLVGYNRILLNSGSNTLELKTDGTISGVRTPVNQNDATTKNYVDTQISNIPPVDLSELENKTQNISLNETDGTKTTMTQELILQDSNIITSLGVQTTTSINTLGGLNTTGFDFIVVNNDITVTELQVFLTQWSANASTQKTGAIWLDGNTTPLAQVTITRTNTTQDGLRATEPLPSPVTCTVGNKYVVAFYNVVINDDLSDQVNPPSGNNIQVVGGRRSASIFPTGIEYPTTANNDQIASYGTFLYETSAGFKNLTCAEPTLASHATTKSYVDINSTLQQTYDNSPNGFIILNNGFFSVSNSLPSGPFGTAQFLVSGDLDVVQIGASTITFSGNRLQSIGTPTTPNDATTKSYVDDLAKQADRWTINFGGSMSVTNVRYLPYSGTASIGSDNNKQIRSYFFNPLLCYIVGCSVIRENVNSLSIFQVEVETAPNSDTFITSNLLTITQDDNTQLAKNWLATPIEVKTDCRIAVKCNGAFQNPQNISVSLFLSYTNSPVVSGGLFSNGGINNIPGTGDESQQSLNEEVVELSNIITRNSGDPQKVHINGSSFILDGYTPP